MPKTLKCRLGMHLWRVHRNDQGQRYRTCERCGKDDDRAGAHLRRAVGDAGALPAGALPAGVRADQAGAPDLGLNTRLDQHRTCRDQRWLRAK